MYQELKWIEYYGLLSMQIIHLGSFAMNNDFQQELSIHDQDQFHHKSFVSCFSFNKVSGSLFRHYVDIADFVTELNSVTFGSWFQKLCPEGSRNELCIVRQSLNHGYE